jgi:hypothetical protein
MMPVNIPYISDCQLPIADLRLGLEVAHQHYDQQDQQTKKEKAKAGERHPDSFSLEREAE